MMEHLSGGRDAEFCHETVPCCFSQGSHCEERQKGALNELKLDPLGLGQLESV